MGTVAWRLKSGGYDLLIEGPNRDAAGGAGLAYAIAALSFAPCPVVWAFLGFALRRAASWHNGCEDKDHAGLVRQCWGDYYQSCLFSRGEVVKQDLDRVSCAVATLCPDRSVGSAFHMDRVFDLLGQFEPRGMALPSWAGRAISYSPHASSWTPGTAGRVLHAVALVIYPFEEYWAADLQFPSRQQIFRNVARRVLVGAASLGDGGGVMELVRDQALRAPGRLRAGGEEEADDDTPVCHVKARDTLRLLARNAFATLQPAQGAYLRYLLALECRGFVEPLIRRHLQEEPQILSLDVPMSLRELDEGASFYADRMGRAAKRLCWNRTTTPNGGNTPDSAAESTSGGSDTDMGSEY